MPNSIFLSPQSEKLICGGLNTERKSPYLQIHKMYTDGFHSSGIRLCPIHENQQKMVWEKQQQRLEMDETENAARTTDN